MVLWILMVISFLASGYAAHNRNKAGMAVHALETLTHKEAAQSVLVLIAAGQYEFLHQKGDDLLNKKMAWTRLSPGGVDLYVRMESEKSRVDMNLAGENDIRKGIQALYGEAYDSDAEALTDALLDWRDSDDLVRLHGAEKEYYEEFAGGCTPGNGKFKSMSEIFLVKGMHSDIFWDSPLDNLHKSIEELTSPGDVETVKKSFLENFTIYAKNGIRVSMVFPGPGKIFHHEVYFIEIQKRSVTVLEHLSRVVMVEKEKEIK